MDFRYVLQPTILGELRTVCLPFIVGKLADVSLVITNDPSGNFVVSTDIQNDGTLASHTILSYLLGRRIIFGSPSCFEGQSLRAGVATMASQAPMDLMPFSLKAQSRLPLLVKYLPQSMCDFVL